MPTLNIDQFKARLIGGGARQNLFQVTCNLPPWVRSAYPVNDLASFMIKGASMPASTLGTIEIPFRGRKLKVAGDRTFEEWTITVINDLSFPVRNAFEYWSNGINSNKGNIGRNLLSEYESDWFINQLDKGGNITKSYVLRGAYPTNVAAIDVSYENEGIQEFQVTMAYQYWESNTTPVQGTGSGPAFGISVSAKVGPFTVAADAVTSI